MAKPRKKRSQTQHQRAPARKIMRHGTFSVYILECSDGTFYTGYTKDLKARLKLHNSGRGSKYVRSRRPARLGYAKKFRYYKLAVTEERRIKSLSRATKEALVASYGGRK
jgi:putative endonuclease